MKKTLFFLYVILITSAAVNAQVGIGSIPSDSSILDLTNSNSKYLILPSTGVDPGSVLKSPASVIYYNGNIYVKTSEGIKVFTPWKWDGDSTHSVSSPSTAAVGIGITPAMGTPCRMQIANSPAEVNEIGSNASVIVGVMSSNHLLIDNNEIMAKKNATTADTLRFQEENGAVAIRSAANNGGNNTVLKVYGSIESTGNIKAVNINATGKIQESGIELLPQGSIIMWSGLTVPTGWTLCDGVPHGSLNVPDLRDRFIVGSGLSYSSGNSGGENFVTLTINEMPTHNHPLNDPGHSHSFPLCNSAGEGDVDDATDARGSKSTSTNTTGITMATRGGGQPHENRPPYFALAFIMKL